MAARNAASKKVCLRTLIFIKSSERKNDKSSQKTLESKDAKNKFMCGILVTLTNFIYQERLAPFYGRMAK